MPKREKPSMVKRWFSSWKVEIVGWGVGMRSKELRLHAGNGEMLNGNKLGGYLWKRINQDQEALRDSRPPNIRGLYFSTKDLNRYIRDYFNYGMDWDDTSKEDLTDRYWDEKDEDVY